MTSNKVLHFYQSPALSEGKLRETLNRLKKVNSSVVSVESEFCYNVQCENLDKKDTEILRWLFNASFDPLAIKEEGGSVLRARSANPGVMVVEIGPRLNFGTAFSTNAVSICKAIGLAHKVSRLERSTLYLITLNEKSRLDEGTERGLVNVLHDRMTEQRYVAPITSFELAIKSQPWCDIDVLSRGTQALEEISNQMGLAFDQQDLEYYTELFKEKLKRNPTSVECFDLAQSNSEHSRHWFFKGRMIIDGNELEESLIDMIIETQKHTNPNNVIKFEDNSSAIKGFSGLKVMAPADCDQASMIGVRDDVTRHIIFTAETHNFPTGVAPFPGATTGTGGRIRDVQAAGRGAHVVAGSAGYCFGNLRIPGYVQPWEQDGEVYPGNFASPLDICINASNGASDYGNKFGEPVLVGFSRSFGMRLENGERREWIKPIMFSGGIGTIDEAFVNKNHPEKDMLVVKVGGPVYRIGVGGGAASSIEVQGDEVNEELDFGAVQRGDAEMEQKLNRVIRACIERLGSNPIQSIHDQGAGGNGNVLKELVEPQGAVIYADRFSLGDPTINTLELWGAEYQESNAILVRPEDRTILEKIGKREKCPIDFVGTVTGDGIARLVEAGQSPEDSLPVNVSLELVLGNMPRKVFHLDSVAPILKPLSLPPQLRVLDALDRVLRLPSVASKRYLTNKVDRSVTGLVAQQQCVGPLHTPLADYGVIALSYFETVGSATSIGEQPLKGLISSGSNARMTVAEALTNLMFVVISDLRDVKCSGNWMWPAKLSGEGAQLVATCEAMCQVMKVFGIAIDGGKDSLSMAAKVKHDASNSEVVKSPGTLVISTYAPVPNIALKVTPELRAGKEGKLIYLDLSGRQGSSRAGASALAQVYGQLGNEAPDLDDPTKLHSGFKIVQNLIRDKHCTAGHDVSDGGIITTLLEMAFATNCGVRAHFKSLSSKEEPLHTLFAEECGVIIEVKGSSLNVAIEQFKEAGIPYQVIGEAIYDVDLVEVSVNGQLVVQEKMTSLRDTWEETSFRLDALQANPVCVAQEQNDMKTRTKPAWQLTFDPNETILRILDNAEHLPSLLPRVAVLREEGNNGDREMIASLYMAGFEVADVTTTDIINDNFSLDSFRGLVFPGGFSYADVLGSARGWAATLQFNDRARQQLQLFKQRPDTFSLGVCNGCQLLALLGWVGPRDDNGTPGTLLDHNDSERYESRFVSVAIDKDSPAIMLRGMQGSNLGVWVAHGEGKFTFASPDVLNGLNSNKLVALRYTDDSGQQTQRYPMNPNGSPNGIAGVCSKDGRHLAMMPHPERCTQLWQWPYLPSDWSHVRVSPWCKMFTNAFDWCRAE
ncbi:Phosphoribosylformylglycinamidine synthase [Halotydeus destructor]|nr:Phosphoribosylformylglycinamidine synthase [Halotydeus destructor]